MFLPSSERDRHSQTGQRDLPPRGSKRLNIPTFRAVVLGPAPRAALPISTPKQCPAPAAVPLNRSLVPASWILHHDLPCMRSTRYVTRHPPSSAHGLSTAAPATHRPPRCSRARILWDWLGPEQITCAIEARAKPRSQRRFLIKGRVMTARLAARGTARHSRQGFRAR